MVTKGRFKLFSLIISVAVLTVALTPIAIGSVVDVVNPEASERGAWDSEAVAPLIVFAMGALIGSGATWFFMSNNGNNDSPSLPNPEAEAREQLNDFEGYFATHFSDIDGGLNIDTQMMQFTHMYWNRCAELAVAEQWSSSGQMNDRVILANSTIMSNLGTHLRSWQSIADTPFDRLNNLPSLNHAAGFDDIT